MKRTLLTMLVVMTLVPCHARWGFSYEECLKQYGKPTRKKVDDTTGILNSATFKLQDIVIRTFFVDKRVTRITYRRSDDQGLSADTLLKILSAYSDPKNKLYFQPPEVLERMAAAEGTIDPEKILAASVKQQVWIRHGEKSSVALLASYNRTAKMLVIDTLLDKTNSGEKTLGF